VTLGLTYRIFGEIAEPPDGVQDPALPPGIKVKDLLRHRLRITAAEVTRRMKLAARIRPRPSLTGPPRPPELEALAAAVEDGALGEDHIQKVQKALDALPNCVSPDDMARAEADLVRHARTQDSAFVTQIGHTLSDVYNPDGIFDDADRTASSYLTLHKQGPDGMSKITGNLTPEARAHLEAIGAAVRPGHHLPGAGHTVVDAATDTRTPGQRLHDALNWGLRTALESGNLGTHRGIPVTVIATTTVAELEQAAHASLDPNLPMPKPARTGSGARLPMRDLIRMAADAIHYLAVFEDHFRPAALPRPITTHRQHRPTHPLLRPRPRLHRPQLHHPRRPVRSPPHPRLEHRRPHQRRPTPLQLRPPPPRRHQRHLPHRNHQNRPPRLDRQHRSTPNQPVPPPRRTTRQPRRRRPLSC
ncbi:MAG: DUF222 domain-containing protein, partial [Mycobacterium sp.]